MSIFAGIDKVEVSAAGQNFRAGRYEVEIDSVTTFVSRKGVPFFLVKATVQQTTSTYAPGSSVDWLVNLNQDWALANVKEFALALIPGDVVEQARAAGEESQLITEATIEGMIGPEQPCAGMRVEVDAIERISKATGNPWVHARWQKLGSLSFGFAEA